MTRVHAALSRQSAVSAACAVTCAAFVWLLFVRSVVPADLRVFLTAAHTVATGTSPYVDPTSSEVWSGHAFVYPYFAAWLFTPLIGLSTAGAGLAFYLLSVVAIVVAVRLLNRDPSPWILVSALVAAPVVRGLQLGTVNAWLLVGLAVAWRYRHRTGVLVAALVTVIVVKLFLLPMVAWLLLSGRRQAAAWTVAVSGAAIALGCAVAHLGVLDFVRMLDALSTHEAPQSSSIGGILSKIGFAHVLVRVGPLLVAAAAVTVGAVLARRRGTETPLFLAAVLASLASSPIVWSHYYTLLLVVPLVLHWSTRAHVVASISTWLLAVPAGAAALSVLHPFPQAGWVWTAALITVAFWRPLKARRKALPRGAPSPARTHSCIRRTTRAPISTRAPASSSPCASPVRSASEQSPRRHT